LSGCETITGLMGTFCVSQIPEICYSYTKMHVQVNTLISSYHSFI